MPIRLIEKSFLDLQEPSFTVTYPDLKGNTGDRYRGDFVFSSIIAFNSVPSDAISHIYNVNANQFNVPNQDPLQEGFRIGDYVRFIKNSSFAGQGVISDINGTVMSFTAPVPTVDPQNDTFNIYNESQNLAGTQSQRRSEVYTELNFVPFSSGGNSNSIIDSEITRFEYGDLRLINSTGFYTGTPVSNQSGMYIESSKLYDVTNEYGLEVDNQLTRYYKIEFFFIISGFYRPDLFELGDCINLSLQTNWLRLPNEISNQYDHNELFECNVGRFNEAYNLDSQPFSVVQSIGALNYAALGEYEIKIECDDLLNAPNIIGLGAAYNSASDSYFKNKVESQLNLSMIGYTWILGGFFNTSGLNPDGAGYEYELLNTTIVGNLLTTTVQFRPNQEFIDFMDAAGGGDRNMKIWIKVDKVNVLVFDAQAERIPVDIGDIQFNYSGFLDHSQNTNTINTNLISYSSNTEDDIGFECSFNLNYFEEVDSILGQMVAYNAVSQEIFSLQNASFVINNIPQDASGRYILNETLPQVNSLPTTSEKRNALLRLDPVNDTTTTYAVSLYLPYLNRWEYWIPQTNANSDFYPNNQTRNWFPYSSTYPWSVMTRVGIVKNGTIQDKKLVSEIKNYDSNPDIDQTITLIRKSTGQVVSIIIENEIMTIRADHQLVNGGTWIAGDVWGMITVEPKESATRYIASSAVDKDNNPLNPLIIENANTITITYPTSDTARLECDFDPSIMDLTNGVSITSKIKGCVAGANQSKSTTDNQEKKTTTNDIKLKSL
tara:strand:+ start:2199 stop:4520 length:2322 start_codon:yes stop_codon:yes gene_type:complete